MVVARDHPEDAGRDDAFTATLAAARQGSPVAARTLYDSLGGRVCAYLGFHGAPDAEDLTSEVFLRVFRSLDQFTGSERAFRAWVFTIARRVLIDEHRRAQRRPVTVRLAAPITESVTGGDVEAEAMAGVERDGVAALLASLTPEQREVVALRIIADLSIDHVAEILGKEPGTVKALQHRGIAALRRQFETART